MAIGPGSRLGPYEVIALIGEGGMGKVWRAHHSALKRDDALKVLPDAFVSDPERLARFQREAQVLALLNHPNIAHVHGFERSDGVQALVMELVEGPTLADRIAQGPIPVDEALPIAKQIAEALEAAHERGIIHRDLKPANIKVRPDGTVKVLDFGLAKALEPTTGTGIDATASPTITSPAMMTGVGMLLGTAAYMSPEQARGKTVDRRSDIWAFGCVLYEMLTGKRAFEGEDVTEILAAILKSEPDWNRLPRDTPPAIPVILQRSLRKDLNRRLPDVAGIRIEIEEMLVAPTRASLVESSATTRSRQVAALGVTALLLLGAGGLVGWYLKPAAASNTSTVARLAIALPLGDRLSRTDIPVAISPDGTEVVYAATHAGIQQLYLRSLNSSTIRPLPGTERASNPFFSPDGRWVGFFADGRMKKVSLSGGAPLTLCEAGLNGGATWGLDDTIVFAPAGQGLWRIPASGGQPEVLTIPDPTMSEYSHRYPQFLPGGKAVVFTALGGFGWDESRVELLQMDTKERRVLVRCGHTGRFIASGHLVYYRGGNLLAVRFDVARQQVVSTSPLTVVEGVRQTAGTSAAAYAVSDTGTLAYIAASPRQFESQLVWVTRGGDVQSVPAPARAYSPVALAPDGAKVALTVVADTEQLWTYDLTRGTLTQFTSGRSSSREASWTPDARRIAYRSNRAGEWNLFWRPSDGTGPEERLTTSDRSQAEISFAGDGSLMAFSQLDPATGFDIWVLRLPSREPQPFVQTSFNERNARLSRDGRWLAYSSDESGGQEIYVETVPRTGVKWRLSSGGGVEPRWNPNGRELFYRSGSKVMTVDLGRSSGITPGTPRLLFDRTDVSANLSQWDVSPDGQRFLMVRPSEAAEQADIQIGMVLNWHEELKRLVPVN